jgi:hypothetical protein
MSNMQVEKYVRVSAQALLYDKSPKVIDNLVDRQTIRYYPQTSRTANPNDQVVFEISSDSFADLPSFVLSFDLNFSGTSTSGETQIASALDIFEINEVYYNDVPCDRIINGGAWNNTFLNLACSRSWVDEEGSIMLGLNNQFTTKNSNPTNRRYVCPVALILPFFRINQYLPLVSNKLRITFTLASPERVITRTFVNNCTYSISNISLTGDIVVASPDHRKAVIDAMKMSTMRIPFLSYDCGNLSVVGTNENYLRINQNHSNALSLHMLY